MENNFDLEHMQGFRINPQVWLQTLLAIAGDKEMKTEIVQKIARESGFHLDQVEVLMATTIRILMNQTRSN